MMAQMPEYGKNQARNSRSKGNQMDFKLGIGGTTFLSLFGAATLAAANFNPDLSLAVLDRSRDIARKLFSLHVA